MNGTDSSGWGDEFIGTGGWTYDGQAPTYGQYNSPTAHAALRYPSSAQAQSSERQQSRPQTRPAHPSLSTQNDIQYYDQQPTYPLPYRQQSWADVVRAPSPAQRRRTGHYHVHPAVPSVPHQSQPTPARQQAPRPQPRQPSMCLPVNPSNAPQVPLPGRSWAQVAATAQTHRRSQQQHVAINNVNYGHSAAMYQMEQPSMDPTQYNHQGNAGYQTPAAANPYPPAQPWTTMDNADDYEDFDLFDDSILDWLSEPKIPEDRAGLFVDTLSTPQPSRLLMSPTDSIETSSVASSTGRRSKREIMNGSGLHKCRLCGGGFNSVDDRKKHELRVHLPYAMRPCPCPKCPKRFLYKKDLKRHLEVHDGVARFFCTFIGCPYGGKGFARKDHYNRHMATHFKADSAVQMSRSTSAHPSSQG